MPYARKYTPSEVKAILDACENNRNGGNPNAAHTYGQHLNITKQGMQTRVISELKAAATKFATSEDLVGAAYEGLNSATGQAELALLDSGAKTRVTIKHKLVGNYDVDAEFGEVWSPPLLFFEGMSNNQAKAGVKALSAGGSLGGVQNQRAKKVVLIVDANVAGTPWIQTCYPDLE